MSIKEICQELQESGQLQDLLDEAAQSLGEMMDNEAIIRQIQQIALSSKDENFAAQIAGMNHSNASHFNQVFHRMAQWMFASMVRMHVNRMDADSDESPTITEDGWVDDGGGGVAECEAIGPDMEHDDDAPTVEELNELFGD